jgi:deazaflavin-dependent oxidoreductase (nitroreductase family)
MAGILLRRAPSGLSPRTQPHRVDVAPAEDDRRRMTSVRHRMTSAGNRLGVRLYRALDGRYLFGGGDKVLVVTAPGRRTGTPRSTCVRYLDVPEGFLVWGTASGAPSDPDWFRNLRHAPAATVQVGERRVDVHPRELRGDERDRAWADVLAAAPGVARYARKAGRTIPVAVLERGGPTPG